MFSCPVSCVSFVRKIFTPFSGLTPPPLFFLKCAYLLIINAHRTEFAGRKQAWYISNYMASAWVNKPLHLGDMWNLASAVGTLLVPAISQLHCKQTFSMWGKDREQRVNGLFWNIFLWPVIGFLEFEARNGVTLCNYMSLWLWSSSFIFVIVSPVGHTIARQPVSHEETWVSPCRKDGFALRWGNHQGKNCCQAICYQTMG